MASKSPRRHFLMEQSGIDFEVRTREIEETYPEDLDVREIAEFLARKKANGVKDLAEPGELIVTADTTVIFDGKMYGKPKGREDAIKIIREYSGQMHEVITGVCLVQDIRMHSFSVVTAVHLDALTEEELIYYVDNYKPYDKAGAYGIQEWIGWTKIGKIEGSYTNVMGLPLSHVYEAIKEFIS